MVGPGWKGQTPSGITAVVRSSTSLAFSVPRIFMDDTAEDHKAIEPLISQVVFYPLSEFDGKTKRKDWSKLPHFPAPPSKGETKWVSPETFFDELPCLHCDRHYDRRSRVGTFDQIDAVNHFVTFRLDGQMPNLLLSEAKRKF